MFCFSLKTVPALACLSWSGCDWWLQGFPCCNFCSSCCWCCTCWWSCWGSSSPRVSCCFRFDAVAAYVALDSRLRVVVSFHLAMYLVVGTMLNPLGGIEVHVDVVFLVLSVLQEVLTELVHLMDKLSSFQLSVLGCRLSFVYDGLTQSLW